MNGFLVVARCKEADVPMFLLAEEGKAVSCACEITLAMVRAADPAAGITKILGVYLVDFITGVPTRTWLVVGHEYDATGKPLDDSVVPIGVPDLGGEA